MEKHRRPQPDEVPALNGPDYIALVIEWDDLGDALEDVARGTSTALGSSRAILDDDPAWSRVDEASDESFPASDPPAWGSSHAVAQTAIPEDISEEVTTPFAPKVGPVRRFLLGLAALAAMFSMIEGLRRLRHHLA